MVVDDDDKLHIPSMAVSHSRVVLPSMISYSVFELLSESGVDDDEDSVVHISPMVPSHSECDFSSDISLLPGLALCLCS